jgi:hypothetical protein
LGETSTITVTATDPTNGSTISQQFTVTVIAYAGPTDPAINFRPFASPVTTTAASGTSTTITLNGVSGYPDTTKPSTLSYALVSQPSHGTISQFNPSTGTFLYTPNKGFVGTDSLQYIVNATGPQTTPAVTTSNPSTVTITVTPAPPVSTGAVRVVGTVLLVTPLPEVGHGRNKIEVLQVPNSSSASGFVLEVMVNGQVDITQPSTASVDSIVVFGAKASDTITIDPSVTVPATIDGGHGGRNVLKGGGTFTVEHGWFGHNVLIGRTGFNELIGRAGQVRFKPSSSTIYIFAGVPNHRTPMLNPTPPGGTFYKFVKGRLVPVPESALFPHAGSHKRSSKHPKHGHHKKP